MERSLTSVNIAAKDSQAMQFDQSSSNSHKSQTIRMWYM